MSKATKTALRVAALPIASKQEAFALAQFIKAGKQTRTREEAIKLFGEAADILDVEFKRMDGNQVAMFEAEAALAKNAKILIGRCKDLAGQVGDAMARIDKVIAKDFEQKLSQLERFAAAMAALDELKRSGRLDGVVAAFNNHDL
jgi:hypothetical protein